MRSSIVSPRYGRREHSAAQALKGAGPTAILSDLGEEIFACELTTMIKQAVDLKTVKSKSVKPEIS
jgi:hypothetical protein